MNQQVAARAGQPAPRSALIDVDAVVEAYTALQPDVRASDQRVAFGTSGHRGLSLTRSFNEWHILAITQAICDERAAHGVDGPLFLGIDTHALSVPARDTALQVLAANGVQVRLAPDDEYTPTPAVSLAIIDHNRDRHDKGLADGIVITPSHNPPAFGGFKYNPANGGPAPTTVTSRIERAANAYLESRLEYVKREPLAAALEASCVQRYDFERRYVEALDEVVDMAAIRAAGLRLAVDPLGGAGVHYWRHIAQHYDLDLTVVSEAVDPTFAFMTLDWDGEIRMDPSSSYAMQRLLALKDDYDIAFACDTDHDRHGVVTPAGLMPSNDYLCALIDYLFTHRPHWPQRLAIGKTAVSTALIDRVAAHLGRHVHETPTGFKWFADGLSCAKLGFAGEESAGAAFARRDGRAWTADKDGITAGLLAAEITARTGADPAKRYETLAASLGRPHAERIEAPASPAQKKRLAGAHAAALDVDTLAGEAIVQRLDRAPGNDAPLGGIKVVATDGWFAARPSGTEDLYKIYAESFRDEAHLQRIVAEARDIVAGLITPSTTEDDRDAHR